MMLYKVQASNFFKRWSHIGRKPIPFDSRVKVSILDALGPHPTVYGHTRIEKEVQVSGPLGTLKFPIHRGLEATLSEGRVSGEMQINISLNDSFIDRIHKRGNQFIRAMWGTTAAILRQHVEGVTEGHQVVLKLVGVGYKASYSNSKISLNVGHSHDVHVQIPADVSVSIPNPTRIILLGPNLQRVTQLAAIIRSKRNPEPYNGKGIFVGDETIKLKQGKKK